MRRSRGCWCRASPATSAASTSASCPKALLKNYDGLSIKTNPDREGLDLNRNFPAYWRQQFEQTGAGPYPTSEPEVRAMVDFIVKHPNIGAAISFHTHSGVILRPMGTQSDDDMTPEDLWIYKRLSELGTRLSGYPAISTFHDFKYHPKEVVTGTQDWIYEHLGALFWTVELWAPNREAGITDYDWIHWYREHPPEDDLKLLKWSDEQCGGQAHVDWYAFQHPQLGAVELGGWDKMNYWRNPPPAPARARGGALPRLDDADRAVAAQAGGAARGGARAGRGHLACALRGGQCRLPAGLHQQARAGAQDGARRGLQHPPAAGPEPGQRRRAHRRPAARRPCAEDLDAGLPAQPGHHRRPRGGRVDRARPARRARSA